MSNEAEFLAAEAAFKPRTRGSVVVALLGGLVAGAIVGAGAMAAFGGAPAKKSRARAEAPVVSAAPAPSASAAAAPEAAKPSLAARASAGEKAAIDTLTARPREERTAEEVRALSEARVLAKKAEIAELKRKITLVPKIIDEDKQTASRIKELTADREVAVPMMTMLIELPGTTGTDLLYSLYRDMKSGSDNAQLAEDLLYSKDVRARLSPGLVALLNVRKAEKCDEALASLKQLKEDGDRRALPSMMRFFNKRGCGEKKTDDCWKCLRTPDILKEVTAEIAKHPAP